eukprot:TRINITY_DN13876_c0_g1_i1.p6 TRINITY_DN13876_c0_g1~~TRINITY_DN13876_c0_g1_i1.p6  ORF type:complete len:133 (-),score=4.33 TRINITY_DN13876_c0_g1_i1:35-433(-)
MFCCMATVVVYRSSSFISQAQRIFLFGVWFVEDTRVCLDPRTPYEKFSVIRFGRKLRSRLFPMLFLKKQKQYLQREYYLGQILDVGVVGDMIRSHLIYIVVYQTGLLTSQELWRKQWAKTVVAQFNIQFQAR